MPIDGRPMFGNCGGKFFLVVISIFPSFFGAKTIKTVFSTSKTLLFLGQQCVKYE